MFGSIRIKHLETRRQQSLRKPHNARRGSGFVQPGLSGWASRKYLAPPGKIRLIHGTARVDLVPTTGLYPITLKSLQSIRRAALKPKQEIGAGMTQDADFDADLARYPSRPFLKERSVWAIFVYRFGRRVLKQKPGLKQYVLLKIYWVLFRIVETITKISLPLNASIGAGIRINHFGMIFIHSDSIIGRNCTMQTRSNCWKHERRWSSPSNWRPC